MLDMLKNIIRTYRQDIVEHVAESQKAKILHESENEVWFLSSNPVVKEVHKKGRHLGVLEEYEGIPEGIVPEDAKMYFIADKDSLKPKDGYRVQYFRYSDNYLNDVYLRHAAAHRA